LVKEEFITDLSQGRTGTSNSPNEL